MNARLLSRRSSFPLAARPLGFAFALGVVFSTAPSLRAQRMELTDSSAQPVVVETATIHTEVTGRLAVTTFDLVFRNPNNRVLEGTFTFPLLDGQNVVRFALDINGTLREAVPVEKTKGRVVFEDIERRRIDPGLLEQTAGNNYRARVYPIPAHGTRRIVIAYQEDVAHSANASAKTHPVYRLALDFPHPLKQLALKLVVHADTTAPAKIRSTLPFKLPPWRDAHLLEILERDTDAQGLLELELPRSDRPSVLVGRAGHDDTEYFYAEAPVAVPALARPAPRTVGILWDSSGSGQGRDHAREFALLDAWFAAAGSVEVHLIELRDRPSAPQRFTVTKGNWSALKSALKKIAYDGATSLDELEDLPAADAWLLFSDGLINYGVSARHAKLGLQNAPLHTLLASPRADPLLLRALAQRHDGEFVNLLETTPTAATHRLRHRSPRVLDVTYNAGALAEVFPEPNTPVADDTLIVTGILRAATTVELKIGHTLADAKTLTLDLRPGENASSLAARAWAATKINHLALDPIANREDIRRTAQKFGIVTADTSLIVLETVADYVRYDIAPPDELRKEWFAQRQHNQLFRQKGRDDHLEHIVRLFEQRVAWWEREFPKDTPPPHWRPEPVYFPPAPRTFSGAPQFPTQSNLPIGGEEIIVLQPFTVSTERDTSLRAAATSSAPTHSRNIGNVVVGGALGEAKAREITGRVATGAWTSDNTITLQRWTPNAAYLDRLRRAHPDRAYQVYLEERTTRHRQPGFFLDAANFFFERDTPELAFRVLSNLAELELEDVALLRVLAHRLTQADRPDLALPLFERIFALRPDEPQSRRDLALVYADLKQPQRAIDLLWEIVTQPWDARFHGIQLIALTELNALAATCDEPLDLSRVDPRLRKNLLVETRVVLTWDANDCDIDLWVTDPNKQRAAYDCPLTYQGGLMSRDFTAGYGPEEFVLRAPKPGRYRVHIDYYADSRQTAIGPVTAQLRLITGFGTPQQKEKRVTLRLADKKQNREVGVFEIADPRVSQR